MANYKTVFTLVRDTWENMYSYILYYSFSKSEISNAELKELLKKSVEWNSRKNITGLLIYRFNQEFNRGNFLQIVEGPKKSIDNVWPRISNDNRHHTITILEEGSYEERNFPNWSMGFKNLKDHDFKELSGFLELTDEKFWADISNHRPRAFELLKRFYNN